MPASQPSEHLSHPPSAEMNTQKTQLYPLKAASCATRKEK
jgi:hypothetical protein